MAIFVFGPIREQIMRKMDFEKLESKEMMARDSMAIESDAFLIPDEAAQISTPIAGAATIAKAPLASLPQLSSNPNATAKLVLDFDGNFLASWGGKQNVTTPAYDIDGDKTTFSDQEIANIRAIWERVAEDFAPFNVDVTTIDPGVLTDKVVAKIAIGGSYSDWYGSSAGGTSYIGGFSNAAPNVGFAFEDSLGNGNVKYTSEAISHEAGHLFGLQHQAKWDGTTFVTAYNQGNSAWAPIMGVGYYSAVTTWYNGPTSASSTSFQDDMAIIAGANNGFGYRVNPNGSMATAINLDSAFNVKSLIAQNTDKQFWKFTTTGGIATFNVTTAGAGIANFDSVLDIYNEAGSIVYTANSATSMDSVLSVNLTSGTYYAVVHSTGVYGYVGQYTLSGTFAYDQIAPEVTVLLDSNGIADGGNVSFGTTQVGTFVDRTFTVRNDGNSVLTLGGITGLPTGFTLLSDIGATSLQPGQTTTFTLRMDATITGTFSGIIHFNSNDADEGIYDINISGIVSPPPAPEVTVLTGTTGVADGGSVSFGTTNVGTVVDKTFTIRNDGNSVLTLQSITGLPNGFSIVSNIGSLSLQSGQSTTFTIRMTATVAGSYSGVIRFNSDDADEGTYDINVSGTVTAPSVTSAPELTVLLDGKNFVSYTTQASFARVPFGGYMDKTFTIRNDGTAPLVLQPIDTSKFVGAYSVVENIGNLTLQAGETTTFTIRFSGTTAGGQYFVFSFGSNDKDESKFYVQCTGTVLAPAAAQKADMIDLIMAEFATKKK